MNLMWAYFHLRPELISMFVMNNDLQVSPFGTFTRFNRCIQSIQVKTTVCLQLLSGRSKQSSRQGMAL